MGGNNIDTSTKCLRVEIQKKILYFNFDVVPYDSVCLEGTVVGPLPVQRVTVPP